MRYTNIHTYTHRIASLYIDGDQGRQVSLFMYTHTGAATCPSAKQMKLSLFVCVFMCVCVCRRGGGWAGRAAAAPARGASS
jgi:hypothetical protein